MKNLTIKSKLLIIVVTTILVVSAIIATKAISSLYHLTDESIEYYTKQAYKNKEITLKIMFLWQQKVCKVFMMITKMVK